MLPTIFLSHGSPMHAIEAGAAGEVWARITATLPTPKAVLMVTAHWESHVPVLSGNPKPPMIYDFGGFPDALSRIKYSAPGAPDVAARAAALLNAAGIHAGIDHERGMDHGTWVPLLKLFPAANVPVVQLSVQPALSPQHHFDVGRALTPLRDEGVLMVGSGHLTHNLRDWMMARGQTAPLPYAKQFQAWVFEQLMHHRVDALTQYQTLAPEALRAHPTPEHFLPLFVALGAAGDSTATQLYDGFEGNALAMDAYQFG